MKEEQLAKLNRSLQRSTIKHHFVKLAPKLGPDINKSKHQEECTKLMQTLNKAYYRTIQLLSQKEPTFDQTVHEAKVYQRIYTCTVTCQYYESFTIHGYKDHFKIWKQSLKKYLKEEPYQLTKVWTTQAGLQFGDSSKFLYITL